MAQDVHDVYEKIFHAASFNWLFFIEEALSVQYDNVSSPFLYSTHIIHLDNLDKNF